MQTKKSATKSKTAVNIADQLEYALDWLKRKSNQHDRDNMKRFAITAKKFFGVSMATMKVLVKELGRSHELADALWKTGWYEARMVACMIDEPARVSPAQMDRWTRDFDNWGICDTVCFHLFDRTPHAWTMIPKWAKHKDEYVKRTAFALLWSLSVHDKLSGDKPFLDGLKLIERAADDERNFVKKAVNMALRAIGKRNAALNKASGAVATRLADSKEPTSRWVGKDALRELTAPKLQAALAKSKK